MAGVSRLEGIWYLIRDVIASILDRKARLSVCERITGRELRRPDYGRIESLELDLGICATCQGGQGFQEEWHP